MPDRIRVLEGLVYEVGYQDKAPGIDCKLQEITYWVATESQDRRMLEPAQSQSGDMVGAAQAARASHAPYTCWDLFFILETQSSFIWRRKASPTKTVFLAVASSSKVRASSCVLLRMKV